MKKLILSVGVALLASQASFAAEKLPKILVSVSQCVSVIDDPSNGSVTNLKNLAIGSESLENQNGKLTIATRDFEVNGEKRSGLTAKFASKDGQVVRINLSISAGGDGIASMMNCESESDVGRIGIMASYNLK